MDEPATTALTARLPRGPHQLSRQQVEQSQRDRLLMGAVEAVAAKGYAATSVADILNRAGVSRATFYQLFDDKLDCFLAACRMASEILAAEMGRELEQAEGAEPATPLHRLDQILGAYLRALVDHPDLARVFLVEVYAAGAPAIRQRRESMDRFVDLVVLTHRDAPGLLGPDEGQRLAAEVLVGAISSMATNAVGAGETERLLELRGPLMELAARIIRTGRAPDADPPAAAAAR